ncbi:MULTISPECIES: hypothetical protein [Pseudomonas]|uniref:hypothetical protein n=1 Tax=Pseudomonas TaxID=286 RepID=UPI0030DCF431
MEFEADFSKKSAVTDRSKLSSIAGLHCAVLNRLEAGLAEKGICQSASRIKLRLGFAGPFGTIKCFIGLSQNVSEITFDPNCAANATANPDHHAMLLISGGSSALSVNEAVGS